MKPKAIPELAARFIAMNNGSAEQAAQKLGTSAASLSRWKSGHSRPREQLEERLRALVDGAGDLVAIAEQGDGNTRLAQLEAAISATIHGLREEFHRTASVSTRQEVLDLVAALFFAHVTSIDRGGRGIGGHLRNRGETSVAALNRFMAQALTTHLPARNGEAKNGSRLSQDRFFAPLSESDEQFASRLLEIFERDAKAFQTLHAVGRDDLINEVFSRFVSTSFVDEKEMGQYLTPSEIVRFMVEVGFHALGSEARQILLDTKLNRADVVVLDPSCGVGSFLAETIRYFHAVVRRNSNQRSAARWLRYFVENRVIGIDKSERMIRLATVNLGLFGASAANLRLANGLARMGSEASANEALDGRVQLILTNPPFGATYSGDEIKHFAMGQGRSRVDSEILFLERYVDWLAPDGVLVSIVPDSILVNRGPFADLRSWLHERCHIDAVFSLPPVTFGAAGTNTKTSVLVLRKRGNIAVDNLTFFGEAKEVGFDVVTRSGQRRRVRTPRSDLPALLGEYRGECQLKLGRRNAVTSRTDRWDASFHVGMPTHVAAAVDRATFLKVSDIASLVDDRIDPRHESAPEFDYIEISDVDTRTALVGHKRILAAEAPSRARKRVRVGDVLVSTVRPERGAVGVVPARLDGAVCSTGFAVLRSKGIHPLALTWILKTDLVRQQMIRSNIGIAYPAISETTCLEIVLPLRRDDLGAISEAAQRLEQAQQHFEVVQQEFLVKVQKLDKDALGTQESSEQFPDLIDSAEPSAAPDVA
ncbi:MAG: N-6 DNA methylase [Pseudorhodoplanes sp.]|nr:N-6 DNA methylase [Pseudorhodoplanes sp.]